MSLSLRISTPREETMIEGVLRLRFEAPDGFRGVLPGHEPATLILMPGVVRLVRGPEPAPYYLATEGGFIEIDRAALSLTTRWAMGGDELGALATMLRARGERRRSIDAEARRLAERHELAARKALARLQREVAG